jgi:hypothetical protein
MIGYILLFALGVSIGWTLACISLIRSIRDDIADLDTERRVLDRERNRLDRDRQLLNERMFVARDQPVRFDLRKKVTP